MPAYRPYTVKVDGVDFVLAADINNLQSDVSDLSLNVKGYGAVGDGVTDDQAAFDLAITAVGAAGGTLFIPPGTYVATIDIDANKRILVSGYGATLKPAASAIAVRLHQGNGGQIKGVVVEGLTIDGNAGSVTGLKFEDTDRSVGRDMFIEDCAIGVLFTNTAGDTTHCEGNGLDDVLVEDCDVGVSFDPTGATVAANSFAECWMNNVGIDNCTTGIDVDNLANMYRTIVKNCVVWVRDNETAVQIGGDMAGARWNLAIESLDATPTAIVGWDIEATATNMDRFAPKTYINGSFTARVQTAGPSFLWDEGGGYRIQVGTDERALRYYRAGDTDPRLIIGQDINSAGKIGVSFGPGSSALDTHLYRDDVGQLRSPSLMRVGASYVDGDHEVVGRFIIGQGSILTIAAGAVTATNGYHTLGGEGAASDDLTTINGGTTGQILVIRPATGGQTITVKNGTGNILCAGDFAMDATVDTMTLIHYGGGWLEIARSGNG